MLGRGGSEMADVSMSPTFRISTGGFTTPLAEASCRLSVNSSLAPESLIRSAILPGGCEGSRGRYAFPACRIPKSLCQKGRNTHLHVMRPKRRILLSWRYE